MDQFCVSCWFLTLDIVKKYWLIELKVVNFCTFIFLKKKFLFVPNLDNFGQLSLKPQSISLDIECFTDFRHKKLVIYVVKHFFFSYFENLRNVIFFCQNTEETSSKAFPCSFCCFCSCASCISAWIIIDKDIWVIICSLCELVLPAWDHCGRSDLILLLLCPFFGCPSSWALSPLFCWAEGIFTEMYWNRDVLKQKLWFYSCIAICRLNL